MISATLVLFFQILTDCKLIANNYQKLLTNQFVISMITDKQFFLFLKFNIKLTVSL